MVRVPEKYEFIRGIKKGGVVLDVGCGNNSPYRMKKRRPDIYYVGIDICDYKQTSPNLADEYIVTSQEKFHDKIRSLGKRFDAVMSCHNIEHVNNRELTLCAMLSVLNREGVIYMSFPSDKSVHFPTRKGALNYYTGHTGYPPKYNEIIDKLLSFNMEILFASQYHKPFLPWLLGLMTEPYSRIRKKVLHYTWSYWGYESIIIAKRKEEV